MTMTVRSTVEADGTPLTTIRIIGSNSHRDFRKLVNRALNCWDSAPSEVKELGDMITVGVVQQDYSRQT